MVVIVFLSSYKYHVGGACTHVDNLSSALNKLGVITYKSYINPYASYIRKLEYFGTLGHYLCYWGLICYLFLTALFLKIRYSFDILNAQEPLAAKASFLLKKLLNFRLYITRHDYLLSLDGKSTLTAKNPSELNAFERFLIKEEKKIHANVDGIIAVDNSIKMDILKYGIERAKIHVVFNFINLEEYRDIDAVYYRTIKQKYNKKIILVPRRLEEKCGVLYAIKAMKELVKERNDCILLSVGDGPDYTMLKRFVDNEGLSDFIIFKLSIPHNRIIVYYAIADVILIPSINVGGRKEATSLSMLEGMAAGKPVIASNIGGLKEVIINGINGYLVPEKDPVELKNKIIEVLNNPKKTQDVIKDAREYITRYHSSDTAARRFLKIYLNKNPDV